MECAMLYNLPVIFCLHALLAALHCASIFCVPLVVAFFNLSDCPLPLLVVLTFIASSIHFVMVTTFGYISTFALRARQSSQRALLSVSLVGIGLVSLAVVLTMSGWEVADVMQALVFVSGILLVYGRLAYLKAPLATLILVASPGMFAGTIVLAAWEKSIEARSWWIWTKLVVPVLCLVHSDGPTSPTTSSRSFVVGKDTMSRSRMKPSSPTTVFRSIAIVAVVLWTGRTILKRGHAHQVGGIVDFLLILELTDCSCWKRWTKCR